MSWQEMAACRGVDTNVFFPERFDHKAFVEAKAICARCKVRQECLDFALAEGFRHGVFGGYGEKQRRSMRRDRGIARAYNKQEAS